MISPAPDYDQIVVRAQERFLTGSERLLGDVEIATLRKNYTFRNVGRLKFVETGWEAVDLYGNIYNVDWSRFYSQSGKRMMDTYVTIQVSKRDENVVLTFDDEVVLIDGKVVFVGSVRNA